MLSDAVEIIMGQSPKGENVNKTGDGYPLLNGPTEFGSQHPIPTQFTDKAVRFAETGDLLFCVRGSTTGRMNWADQKYAIGRGIAAIRHKNDLRLQSLVRGVIEVQLPELLAAATGSTFPNVTGKMIGGLEFSYLPVSAQLEAALTLSSLDDKIELNRRMNETLEEMARALFRDWFVDFGPTRRQMEGTTDPIKIMGGAFPPAKAATLASLFPATLNNNGLPEKWAKVPVGELSEIVGGGTPSTKTEEYWDGGHHRWATPRDLSKLSGTFIRKTERMLTDAGLAKVSSGLSPIGSVLLSSRAPIGYLAIASEPTAINQGFIVMRPTKRFPTYFAKLWCEENMDTIEANANGSTFQEISKKNFKPILVNLPDDDVHSAFSEVAGSLYELVANNEEENQTLAALRDLLLPKLMSGEIRLKDAEGMV